MLSDQERADRALMAWFRAQRLLDRQLVSVTRRPRGYTPTLPMRRVADGRNVRCAVCDGRIVWFTNEGGRAAQRRAEVAAARHLREHIREPFAGGRDGTAKTDSG